MLRKYHKVLSDKIIIAIIKKMDVKTDFLHAVWSMLCPMLLTSIKEMWIKSSDLLLNWTEYPQRKTAVSA